MLAQAGGFGLLKTVVIVVFVRRRAHRAVAPGHLLVDFVVFLALGLGRGRLADRAIEAVLSVQALQQRIVLQHLRDFLAQFKGRKL